MPADFSQRVATLTRHLDGLANIRAINKLYREADESHKWPIRSRFNATDRAIRTVRRSGGTNGGYEYCVQLDSEISRIVNDENNW